AGGRARRRHGRRICGGWAPTSRARGVRRRRRGPVRLLHAGSRRGRGRPAGTQRGPERRRDPRGPLRESLPLYGLREDLRRGATGGRVVTVVPKLELGRVGEIVPREDGIPKVTGQFAYSSDLQAAGMLWGHTLRSPHPHARITAIDLSEAVAMPGVHAVLTHDDVPGEKLYGLE